MDYTEFAGIFTQLNESSEIITLKNTIKLIDAYVAKIFDFTIQPSQPTKNGDKWNVECMIYAKPNSNFSDMLSKIIELLKNIGMTENEINEFKNTSILGNNSPF